MLNSCKNCGSPAEQHNRSDFHTKDTLAKHTARGGVSRDFPKELDEVNGLDVRVSCTKCQNATGWIHPPHPLDKVGEKTRKDLGLTGSHDEHTRDVMMAKQVEEWNAANLAR